VLEVIVRAKASADIRLPCHELSAETDHNQWLAGMSEAKSWI
jgi:hypothetical protein